MHRLRRLGSRQLSLLTVVALAGCGGGSGGGDPGWYYHFICNGDPECLSTNFAGAPSGTSNLGPGQAGVSGCDGLMTFGTRNWGIPPAQQWCDHSPGLTPPPSPSVTVSLSPSTIDAGQSATLTWSSTLMATCTAGGSGGWSGSKGTSGSQQVSPANPGSYTFSLSCSGASGSASGAATLTVNVPPPSVHLTVSPATITLGQSATLAWTTWQYAACTASGPWSGAVALNGSQVVTPTVAGTYTYALSCVSFNKGTGSGSATLTVAPASGPPPPPPPTVSLSAATSYPSCIDAGTATTLTWSSSNATSCTASGTWGGSLATSGSQLVDPGTNTTTAYTTLDYLLSCTGPGGSASAATTVCVVPPNGPPPPPPTLSLTLTPTSVALGESTTLAWSSQYAGSCVASDAWTGQQSLSGALQITPQSTGIFSYQLHCQGYQGAASGIALLNVQVASGTVPLAARFCGPQGLAIDAADTLYVADTGNQTIRKITAAGVVSTVAGLAGYPAFADGLGATARFSYPAGVGVDGAGTVYVADYGNDAIRQLTPDGEVSTLAGRPGNLGNGVPTDGTGALASFYRPSGVAPDGSGNVFVADYGLGAIRQVAPGGVVTTLAGLWGAAGSADGTGAAARFSGPSGVVVLPSGDLYVADQGNHTIRKIAPGGVVTTFAGTAGVQGAADGQGTAARFFHPAALAVDSQGNLIVADKDNRKIRKITPGGLVSTFATGTGAYPSGTFYYPVGLALDSAGNIYLTDGTAAIRKLTPDGVLTTYAGQQDLCGTNN